jgi:hypothetical protein
MHIGCYPAQWIFEEILRAGQSEPRRRKSKNRGGSQVLGIIYNTLKNNWVFRDFNNFELAE